MNALAKTDDVQLQRIKKSPRELVVDVLSAEAKALAIQRAYEEASRSWYAARRLPEGSGWSAQVAMMPTQGALEHLHREWSKAVATAPDDRLNRILLGLCLDTFRSRDGNPETFVEATVNDLREMGFAPIVVAIALQSVRRKSKFTPSLAEIVEACEAAREEAERKPGLLAFMIGERRRAERYASVAPL